MPVALIIEDEPKVRSFLAVVLESLGYKVLEAGTGHAAEALMQRTPFDLVVLDVMLPDIVGLELMPVVRKAQSGVPVLVVSANDVQSEATDCGADAFLRKPFSYTEMAMAVNGFQRTEQNSQHRN